MKKRRIKAKFRPEQLLAQLLRAKPLHSPGEEDFFCITVIRPDPNFPTWEERLICFGTYEIAVRQAVELVVSLRQSGYRPTHMECHHLNDESATRMILEGMRSEKRYRQEIKAQPNN